VNGLAIEVALDDPRWGEGFGDIEALSRRAALAAFAVAGLVPAAGLELSLLLAGDAELRRLNREFRGIDKPTNVLAFPGEEAGEEASGGRLLGDVALGYETVCREARERDIAAPDHLVHLVIHGCLHLAGYDHHEDADAARMEAAEVAALARLGRPDPYNPEAAVPASQAAGLVPRQTVR
jgi:probable rRNA maturation factor